MVWVGADDEAAVGGVNADVADDDDDKFNPPINDGEFCCCADTKCR